jgi:hypothetical protein
MASTTTKPKMMITNEACVITVGARAPVYEKAIVRDRRTGKLAEVDLNPERPPVDEGDPGRFYVFRRGEEVPADHEAVLAAPECFREADD